jgi:hypothetical protein
MNESERILIFSLLLDSSPKNALKRSSSDVLKNSLSDAYNFNDEMETNIVFQIAGD